MTLLEEIQESAVDSSSDLGQLLRKCKILAARLGSQAVEDWLLWESNGYPEDVDVPDYRIWPLEVKGHFFGPYGSGMRNAPIPYVCIPEEARKGYEEYSFRMSIATIEATLRVDHEGPVQVGTGDLARALHNKVYKGQHCGQAWAEFSKFALVEVLNTVRNRILDFALAIWKEEPLAGNSVEGAASVIEVSRVTQIFNTTVLGGSANLVGTAIKSAVTFNIEANNFESLSEALRDNGLTEDDVSELKTALESDDKPTSGDKFGPRVSAWIAKMTQKAADGSWAIGLGAAGSLLAQAIAKYYGL